MAASRPKEPAATATKGAKTASSKPAMPTQSAAKPAVKETTAKKKSAPPASRAEVKTKTPSTPKSSAKTPAAKAPVAVPKTAAKPAAKPKPEAAKPAAKTKSQPAPAAAKATKAPAGKGKSATTTPPPSAAKGKSAPAAKPAPAEAKTPKTKTASVKATPEKATPEKGSEKGAKKNGAEIATTGKPSKPAPSNKEANGSVAAAAPTVQSKKIEPQPAPAAKPATATVAPANQLPSVPTADVTNKPVKKKTAGSKEKAAKALLSKLPKEIFSARTGVSNAEPFSQKDLDKFRKNIEFKREEQVKDLDISKDLLEDATSRDSADDNSAYSLHMEQGTDAMEREKRYLEVQRGSDYLKRLEDAMVRINNGTYGMCRKCGLRLDSRRLLEVPIAQVCSTYKNTNKLCEPGKLYKEALDPDEE